MKNKEIADLFEKLADILQLKGENVFKINAYRRAARIISDLTADIQVISDEGQLQDIPGIGEGIAKKIREYLDTGKMSKYEQARSSVPAKLIEIMSIPGMGPKTVALIHKTLGISSIAQLEKAVKKGRLRELPGMGPKKEENILRGISLLRQSGQRIPLGVAIPIVEEIVSEMTRRTGVQKISPAGSLRRMKETIGDIDILMAAAEGRKIIDSFTSMPQVREVLAAGKTKASVIVGGALQVDLRVVPEVSYGAALQYFTGSKAHNIRLREIAKARGMKISEYGVYQGNKRIGGRKEQEIYAALGLDWIPPEMREDRGEIEVAAEGKLPPLVDEAHIRGDLHVHSNWSDGTGTLEEIAAAANKQGYQYVAICDHSRSLKFAGGLSEERLLRQQEEIQKLNEKLSGLVLLAGTEVDITSDGSLDFPDRLLEKLDVVVASIHSGFKQPMQKIMHRLNCALENPNVDILAHPTGRLISSRPPYSVDLEKLFTKAKETKTALEINAYYDRLDLNDIQARQAAQAGAMLSIGTDAHHPDQFWTIRLGVGVARRGWLRNSDLLNTRSLRELRSFLRSK